MSRVEELKSLTQEELVRLVQELEEQIKKSEENAKLAWSSSIDAARKYDAIKAALKGILDIAR